MLMQTRCVLISVSLHTCLASMRVHDGEVVAEGLLTSLPLQGNSNLRNREQNLHGSRVRNATCDNKTQVEKDGTL